jgi:hypothetical protein
MKLKTTAALATLALLPLCGSLVGAAATQSDTALKDSAQSNAQYKKSSPLVEKVRRATARYRDINVATNENWVPGTPCVSGPNSGAMGVHFIQPSRVGDGVLDADEPEALIYEPQSNGSFRLVGVEFIVLADDWAKLHPDGSTPALEGHLTNYVGAPNRYGLPSFYELHVWAWEHNPNGSFADFNTQVTCEKQGLN